MSLGAVFPGQGAQSVGMLAELAGEYPELTERFSQASAVLGFDLWEMVQAGPAEVLSQTENTQPILLTASIAIWDLWSSRASVAPAFLAGHSLGEYSACVAAGAMQFDDAVRLVRRRGEIMEAAVPRGQGAMAAVMGLDDEAIAQCCDAAEGVVAPANFNAPGQTVIAGAAAAVEDAAARCKEAGAKRAVMLDVSGPFHSPLMVQAKDDFAAVLNTVELSDPRIPVVHNVNATVAADVDTLREYLLEQIAAPVLWNASVQTMLSQGVQSFIEVGPGNVLAGLIRRIAKGTPVQATASPDAFAAACELTAE